MHSESPDPSPVPDRDGAAPDRPDPLIVVDEGQGRVVPAPTAAPSSVSYTHLTLPTNREV